MIVIDHSIKQCCRCGETKPAAMGFYARKRRGFVVPDSACKECVKADNRVRDTAARRARGAKPLRRKEPAQKPATFVVRHLPPRPAREVPCDMAFMAWGGGEPRQDWSARL